MEKEDFSHIGQRQTWGGKQPFGLSQRDRRQHVYTIGKSGTGKTTMLRNLILQDIEAGRGVGLLDPHGDLASDLLDYIPPNRGEDIVYFNPSDQRFPIGFNLLQSVPAKHQPLVASGVVGAFKSIWGDSWGPRMEYILYAAVAALIEADHTSLLGIPRMLIDERYRKWVVNQVRDPMVRRFWEMEFANYEKRFMTEAIAPIQNKVGQLLMARPMRNILGQVTSKIDPRFMMDDRRILIANLSKGMLGEDKANLLGALLVTKFQVAAMSRADIPEADRCPFHLFIDEFHNFSTNSFAGILSEARKYGLCLTLSHQYIEQLNEEIRDAVFGNVGSIIAFRVGNADANVLDREFGGEYNRSQFAELENHEVCVKLLSNGRYGTLFLGKTDPPSGGGYGKGCKWIRRSREKYSTKRVVVEEKINRWLRK